MKFAKEIFEVVGHIPEDGKLTLNIGHGSSHAPSYVEFEGDVWAVHKLHPNIGSLGEDFMEYRKVEDA